MTESTLFVLAIALHATCWYCWVLVRDDKRREAERQQARLDAQAGRLSIKKWLS
jgi:hypothetical protein